MTTVEDSELQAFSRRFDGTVLTPGSDTYDEARSLWNGDIDRRPAVIARCGTAEQVAAAIRFGRDQGLELAVRGGGHSFAGHGCCDDGVMIDLSPMRAISVDAGARRGRCGGGTTWAEFDAATQAHGLAVPGGVISHTGVAGLSLGGGFGWLLRKAGLSCDNLVSARVVTANGDIVTASADEHPDLHWALRGGGGNFGVVTDFEFALHDVGPMVQLGLFFFAAEDGRDAWHFIRDFADGLPEGMGIQLVGFNAPPAPFVPEQYQFAPGYGLIVVGWGSPEEHAAAVQPIRDTGLPRFELVTPVPYCDLQKMLDESAPWGIHAYEKAISLDELPDAAIDVIVERIPQKASPLSIMPVFPLGGAYREVDDDATAFGGSRASKWLFNIAAVAPDAELLATDRAWVRSFWDALRPYASSSGSYVNFLADADQDRVRSAYGATKYERLGAIKAEYDPDNVFHRNANIAPAPAG